MPGQTTVLLIAALVGFACQLIGIYKAISSIPKFRNWFERLAHRNNTVIVPGTAAVTLEGLKARASGTNKPPPNATLVQLTEWTYENITGISKQTVAVLEELDKLNREKTTEIKNEQT